VGAFLRYLVCLLGSYLPPFVDEVGVQVVWYITPCNIVIDLYAASYDRYMFPNLNKLWAGDV
jgi:hypothetical protein